MKSIYVLDTNILIYKLFCEVEINGRKIWGCYDDFSSVKKEVDRLTNDGNALIITPTAMGEVEKLWEAIYDRFVYRKNIRGIKHSEVKKQIKKKIAYLFGKYSYVCYFKNLEANERNVNEVLSFYDNFEAELRKITEKKVSGLPEHVKNRKLSFRVKGYMPEQTDIRLLAECMHIRQNLPDNFNQVYLFTNDSDFTAFKEEIQTFLFVGIHCLER